VSTAASKITWLRQLLQQLQIGHTKGIRCNLIHILRKNGLFTAITNPSLRTQRRWKWRRLKMKDITIKHD